MIMSEWCPKIQSWWEIIPRRHQTVITWTHWLINLSIRKIVSSQCNSALITQHYLWHIPVKVAKSKANQVVAANRKPTEKLWVCDIQSDTWRRLFNKSMGWRKIIFKKEEIGRKKEEIGFNKCNMLGLWIPTQNSWNNLENLSMYRY